MTVAIAAASTRPGAVPLADRLLEQLPWMRHLTASEREAMADELRSEALAGGSATPDAWPFADTLLAWHATAHAKAAGYTPDAELDWYA